MDKDKPTHSYNTRSKRKSGIRSGSKTKRVSVKSIRDSKRNIKNDIEMASKRIIDKNTRNKPTFRDSGSDSDYDPEEELEYMRYLDSLHNEENMKIHLRACARDMKDGEDDGDVDEHGNIRGLIDYDYDDEHDTKILKNKVIIDNGVCDDCDRDGDNGDVHQAGLIYTLLTQTLLDVIDKPVDTIKDKYDISTPSGDRSDETSADRYAKRNLYKKYNIQERNYYEKIDKTERDKILELERELLEDGDSSVPLRFKILRKQLSKSVKRKLLSKVDVLNHIDKGNSEYYKLKRWVDGLMRVPFGKYIEPPVSRTDDSTKIAKYLTDAYDTLDSAVYGHEAAKTEIMLLISKWISNPNSTGNVIGIQGPPGNGKTTLVRQGISKAINKPFAFITLGGATDASFLEGHSYTYEGSIPGRIVEILGERDVGCMNPIFYFDELDKVSDTARGHEIHNILCHLTDFSQNDAFHDKYYSGIDFDLSKCLFIFSFNDINSVNPILRDRMTIIRTYGFNKREKTEMAQRFLLPQIFTELGMDSKNVEFTEHVLGYIITNYTDDEDGVRSFKRKLTRILSKLNVNLLLNGGGVVSERILPHAYKFPMRLTTSIVDQLLKSKSDNSRLTSIEMSMYT